MNKKTIAAGAAAVAIAGTIGLAGTASADSQCGPGATAKVHYENRVNPQTGKTERAKITECPDVVVSGGQGTSISSVTPGVGVDFRDDNGNRTSSGLSNQDQFEYLNAKKPGKNGDGTLIKVKQITKGKGGWGSMYIGWIPVKYTQIPSMF